MRTSCWFSPPPQSCKTGSAIPKLAPCGGVSANPARGLAANPGVPSGATTEIKGGSAFHLLIQETVFHPGHYRIALARNAAQLPPDPVVTTRSSERGDQSVSAVIQDNPAGSRYRGRAVCAH